ncbi:DUF6629 family protein [Azohydromonas lata]|uniref:DUF6629 family protein n=1 Tax=Azohydromonas lata TaxID=45677 RepID=A0ABU5IAG1_9BURK|nr:DUF6629 family protein [Azohydromonas lata]MDZ5455640.1 DUF6629 family protein [Azohydromonas lata]
MCFSANASLAAGTFLTGTGVMALRMVRHRSEFAYASIPLLFAIQQLTEAVVWFTFDSALERINTGAAMLYSLFSHVLWPIYVPVAAWLLERTATRRKALGAVVAVGSGASLPPCSASWCACI